MSANGDIALSREVPFGLIEFEQRAATGYRAYHVTIDGKRERYPSVTTFGGVLAKRALLRWYEEMGVQNALAAERAGLLANVAVQDACEMLRANKMGAEAQSEIAMARGIAIHKVIERYFVEGAIPNPADHPPEHRGYIRGAVRWLLSADERGLEVEATEQLVAHPKLKYAGRYDLRARLGGLSHIIDFKTNRHGRVWSDHHYQPVAYAMADMECGAEVPHACLVVAVGPEGTYEEMQSCASAADVKAIVDVYRRVARMDAGVKAQRERLEAVA